MNFAAGVVVPLVFAGVGALLLFSRREKSQLYFDAFVSGAREGIETAVKLFPTLVALLCAVAMFNASGATELLAKIATPVLSALGIPSELATLLLVRPVSGSASSALAAELLSRVSPDSYAGRCASVILGSSDTAVYIVALYFSAVGAKKARHALPAALCVSVLCAVLACAIVRWLMT
ncbi:MAG: nucleoside recognition domain-containing protein [Eubacteriales bacterium]|jgi:spore maturation protein B